MTGFISTALRDTYDLSFQISPIVLTGGSVGNVPGGMMPIMGLLGGLGGFAQGVIGGLISGAGVTMQDFPWRFIPSPGTTAIAQTAATYPFANRRIAANATVEQPKSVGLKMIWPVNQTGGYATKLALFTSLQSSLSQHNNLGGTYTVVTPSMIFPNCLLLNLSDVTPDSSKQKMILWQWDFIQPLISQSEGLGAFSGLMSMIEGGSKFSVPSWSGAGSSINSAIQGATTIVNSGVSGIIGSVGNFL